jgi:hypothetical protein
VALADLADFLKQKKAANPDGSISIKVDPNSTPDTLSGVMDAATTAGFGVPPYSYLAATPAQLLSTNTPSPAAAPTNTATVSATPNASPALVPATTPPPSATPGPAASPTPPKSTNADANPSPLGPMHPQ